jgi:hypothetical protein
MENGNASLNRSYVDLHSRTFLRLIWTFPALLKTLRERLHTIYKTKCFKAFLWICTFISIGVKSVLQRFMKAAHFKYKIRNISFCFPKRATITTCTSTYWSFSAIENTKELVYCTEQRRHKQKHYTSRGTYIEDKYLNSDCTGMTIMCLQWCFACFTSSIFPEIIQLVVISRGRGIILHQGKCQVLNTRTIFSRDDILFFLYWNFGIETVFLILDKYKYARVNLMSADII